MGVGPFSVLYVVYPLRGLLVFVNEFAVTALFPLDGRPSMNFPVKNQHVQVFVYIDESTLGRYFCCVKKCDPGIIFADRFEQVEWPRAGGRAAECRNERHRARLASLRGEDVARRDIERGKLGRWHGARRE